MAEKCRGLLITSQAELAEMSLEPSGHEGVCRVRRDRSQEGQEKMGGVLSLPASS